MLEVFDVSRHDAQAMHARRGGDHRVLDQIVGSPVHEPGPHAKRRSIHRQDVPDAGDLVDPCFNVSRPRWVFRAQVLDPRLQLTHPLHVYDISEAAKRPVMILVGYNGGGGIFSNGALTVTDSTFRDNRVANDGLGGGLQTFSGTALIVNSKVSHPTRAAARAASTPAWPAPTTITSYCLG